MGRAKPKEVDNILGQMFELLRITRSGIRETSVVSQGLQSLIHGKQLPVHNGLIHGHFTPTDTQRAWVKFFNKEFGWGFTEADFEALGEPPQWLMDNPLAVVTLTPYLDTPKQTFVELWRAAAYRQPESFHRPLTEDSHYGKWAQLRLAPGQHHSRKLAWERINLGYGISRESTKVYQYERPANPAHAAVLAAAAMHPEWVRQMRELKENGDVPFVAIVGYQADRGKYLEPNWNLVPVLEWGEGAQEMLLEYQDTIYDNCATPVHLPLD